MTERGTIPADELHTIILASELHTGSVFLYSEKSIGEQDDLMIMQVRPVTVLRGGEPAKDTFGRDMTRYWCRDDLTDREGWCTFGPGGVVRVKATAPYFVMATQ